MKLTSPRLGAFTLALVVLATTFGEGHKPVTSKYTFNEHVLPIFREHCGACHVEGGAAPMSLTTYADARPWAESIRAELVAAHMPPAQAESAVGPFRNGRLMPPRALDVVLTWATGGTPEGPPAAGPPETKAPRPDWPLGPPDVTIPIPSAVTLAPRALETTEEFRLPSAALEGHAVRAVDLKPGTPSMVRRAIFFVQTRQTESNTGLPPDHVIGIWSPGGDIVAPTDGAAFAFPKGAELVARITYRKTWKYENTAMTDRSAIGVYLTDLSHVREIAAVHLSGHASVSDDVQVIAVRSEIDAGDGDVAATAQLPDGSRILLVRVTGQREWPQRFWYARPVALPRGTRLESQIPIVIDVVGPDR